MQRNGDRIKADADKARLLPFDANGLWSRYCQGPGCQTIIRAPEHTSRHYCSRKCKRAAKAKRE